jgi:multidrug efflux pump subunit AcrA (membrane-fusion protein)
MFAMQRDRRRSRFVAASCVLAVGLLLGACSSDEDPQVADLEQQVAHLESQLEASQNALQDAEDRNAELQDELSSTQDDLATTQDDLESTQGKLSQANDDLASTQAELANAQSQLAEVGKLRLQNGTYVGPVLGAKHSPHPIIVFSSGGLYLVGLVSDSPTITAGGDDFTLAQFGKLLASTDADDVKLANGNYKVIVKNGLVTSIRKSSA